jgi:DNA-binding NarL/FixJ family response regulator
MIKVLIADTHTVLRHGLRLILQEDPGLSVVGEAANATELMVQVECVTPDVVLMDVDLSDQCGIETVRQIRSTSSQPQVLILTVSDQCDNMLPALKAGAKGYLLKSVSGQEVVQAIYEVADGNAVLPRSLTTRLIDELAAPPPVLAELTEREIDVLQCITRGLGNKEIATTLNISQNTVKTHVRRILAKLNLRNRTEAATFALQTDLLAGN